MGKVSSQIEIPQQEDFLPLGKVLCGATASEELLNLSIKSLVETVQSADAGILYLYDERRQQLVARVSHGYHCHHVEHSLGPKEGTPGQCYALGKSLLLASAGAISEQIATLSPENLDCYIKMRQGLPPTLSMIVIPLMFKEKTFGVVLLEHYKQHRPFSEANISQAETLAS